MKTIIEYFKDNQEEMPLWLENYQKNSKIKMKDLFSGRLMFYPGAYIDGNPLGLLNNAHFCHTFIYVDNGVTKKETKERLEDPKAFNGYELYDLIEISEKELAPNGYKMHYVPSKNYLDSIKSWIKITNGEAFCLVAIYQRKEGYDDTHGAKRFALVYLGADANATYDALFVNEIYHIPDLVYLSANMGGEDENFYRGYPLEKIANNGRYLPSYLLIKSCPAWDKYEKVEYLHPALKDGYASIYLYKRID